MENTIDAEVIKTLVREMNNGRGDYAYNVVETVMWRERGSSDGRVVVAERDYIVTRTERGKTIDIATLKFNADGSLRTALVERGLEFHLVPRVLRAVAA